MDADSHEAGGIFDRACTAAPTLLQPERPRPDHLVFVLICCLTLGSGLPAEAASTTCRDNLRRAKAPPPYL